MKRAKALVLALGSFALLVQGCQANVDSRNSKNQQLSKIVPQRPEAGSGSPVAFLGPSGRKVQGLGKPAEFYQAEMDAWVKHYRGVGVAKGAPESLAARSLKSKGLLPSWYPEENVTRIEAKGAFTQSADAGKEEKYSRLTLVFNSDTGKLRVVHLAH